MYIYMGLINFGWNRFSHEPVFLTFPIFHGTMYIIIHVGVKGIY